MQTRLRDVNMKRKYICRLLIVMLASIGLCACGKQGKKEEVKEQISQIFAVRDEVVKKENEIVIEDERVATADVNKEYKVYENESVQFSYPKGWSVAEKRGEDGMRVSLYDGEREVFFMEQGEYWTVILDAKEEEYYQWYQDSYPYLDILGMEDLKMDECDARKINFTYREKNLDYTVVKYMVENDYIGYTFQSEIPTKIVSKYETEIEAICKSVKFKKTDEAKLEQQIYFKKEEYTYANADSYEKVETQVACLYGMCELNDKTIQVYKNTQDELIVATVDEKGNQTILLCEDKSVYQVYEYVFLENEVSKWMTVQEDLFGYPTVKIEILVGASAVNYLIVGDVDGSLQVLFYECESGLICGDVDGDGVKELISSIGGCFYRYEGGRICKYTAVLPEGINQLAWEGNYFSLYPIRGPKKKGELVIVEDGTWSLVEKEYMPIHVFEQKEVEIVPMLEEYTFEQANELGIMTQQEGELPGLGRGIWYTVEINGVVYHYGQYEHQTLEQVELFSYAIVKDTYALANGICVGMTEEDVLTKYPNMAVMNFDNEYLYEAVTSHQGWNGNAYPCITHEEDGVTIRQRWLDQFDYVMIGDINLGNVDTLPIYLGLLMKDGKVAAITKYYPTAG